jgi:NAD(P)-dependent dehydrogenase (short-subunit alcohol dehydrogenase family)
MAIPEYRLTTDGHELQFATKHLSHFLFFKLLEPALLTAASPNLPSRVVTPTSSAHTIHGINETTNYNFERGDYNPMIAYAQSKTANIYMANEIERRYAERNVHATSVHPAIVVQTALAQYMPPDAFKGVDKSALYAAIKSVEQGAATTVWAAIGDKWKSDGGKYLSDCAVAEPYVDGEDKFLTSGYAAHAYDVDEAKRLWRDSLRLVGLPEEE